MLAKSPELLRRVSRSPLMMTAIIGSGLVLTPFLLVCAVILSIGFVFCLPVIIAAGGSAAVLWVWPRAGALVSSVTREAYHLLSLARATHLGIRVELFMRSNPFAASALVCCSPVLIPIGALCAGGAGFVLLLSTPLLVPGACILLMHADFRSMAFAGADRMLTTVRAMLQVEHAEQPPTQGAAPQLSAVPACAADVHEPDVDAHRATQASSLAARALSAAHTPRSSLDSESSEPAYDASEADIDSEADLAPEAGAALANETPQTPSSSSSSTAAADIIPAADIASETGAAPSAAHAARSASASASRPAARDAPDADVAPEVDMTPQVDSAPVARAPVANDAPRTPPSSSSPAAAAAAGAPAAGAPAAGAPAAGAPVAGAPAEVVDALKVRILPKARSMADMSAAEEAPTPSSADDDAAPAAADRSRGRPRQVGLHVRLRDGVDSALLAHGVEPARAQALAGSLPRKWERLGDLVLLPEVACTHPVVAALLDAQQQASSEQQLGRAAAVAAMGACAAVLGVTRVGVQSSIEPSLHRKSRVRMIWPPGVSDGYVRHVENGVTYVFDVTRNMFASGNGTERMRVARLGAPDETVVDLYAGIGYFTLPYLVKAKVRALHACEWDADALVALREGLKANGVAERCMVHAGDNALALPAFAGQAHRVNLGLIPSSEAGWPVAVRALRADGGWLHVHANVSTDDEQRARWLEQLTATLADLAQQAGRHDWAPPVVAHVERVKSYAPRLDHVVVDVWLGPAGARGRNDAGAPA